MASLLITDKPLVSVHSESAARYFNPHQGLCEQALFHLFTSSLYPSTGPLKEVKAFSIQEALALQEDFIKGKVQLSYRRQAFLRVVACVYTAFVMAIVGPLGVAWHAGAILRYVLPMVGHIIKYWATEKGALSSAAAATVHYSKAMGRALLRPTFLMSVATIGINAAFPLTAKEIGSPLFLMQAAATGAAMGMNTSSSTGIWRLAAAFPFMSIAPIGVWGAVHAICILAGLTSFRELFRCPSYEPSLENRNVSALPPIPELEKISMHARALISDAIPAAVTVLSIYKGIPKGLVLGAVSFVCLLMMEMVMPHFILQASISKERVGMIKSLRLWQDFRIAGPGGRPLRWDMSVDNEHLDGNGHFHELLKSQGRKLLATIAFLKKEVPELNVSYPPCPRSIKHSIRWMDQKPTERIQALLAQLEQDQKDYDQMSELYYDFLESAVNSFWTRLRNGSAEEFASRENFVFDEPTTTEIINSSE